MNSNILFGIMIPVSWNSTWFCDGALHEKRDERSASEDASWICVRSDDCSICLVAFDSGNRYVRTIGPDLMAASGGRIFIWNGFPSSFGYINSASSFYRRKAGRCSGTVKKNDDACPGGDAS